MPSVEEVRAAVRTVHDPCSVAAGAALSIEDMGLLRDVRVDGGRVHVVFGVTGPGCTYIGHFAQAVHDAVAALPGVASVQTEVDTATVWDPSALSPAAAGTLRARRETTVRLSGVRPRMWQEER